MPAITLLGNKRVYFVFGANKRGVHSAGAAKHAREHFGAVQGCGSGLRNYSYAIPTKDYDIYTPLALDEVHDYVKGFLAVALVFWDDRPDAVFHVTRIGCGLAAEARGQTQAEADASIAPMFAPSMHNCLLPRQWIKLLPNRPVEAFWPHW